MMRTSASGLHLLSPVKIPNDISGNFSVNSRNLSLLSALVGVV